MQEFRFAAKKATRPKDLELLDVPFGERILYVKRPTPGQIAMWTSHARRTSIFIASMDLLEKIIVTDMKTINEALKGATDDDGNPRPQATKESIGTILYLEELLDDGIIDADLIFGGDGEENKQGLLDAILAEWAGRPTEPSGDSSTSPNGSGPRSTGRVRGKGSISGDSTSTDS